jgi:hypothetical protein
MIRRFPLFAVACLGCGAARHDFRARMLSSEKLIKQKSDNLIREEFDKT